MILYSNKPDLACTLTLSHFFFQSIAFHTGDSFDIVGILDKISASVEPTILKTSFSFDSKFSISIVDPMLTFSHLFPSSLINSTFLSWSSKSEILFST